MAKLSMYQLQKYLPKTDCKKCGFSCLGFANHLISRDVRPEDCPILLEPGYSESLAKLNELLGPGLDFEKEVTGLLIEPEKCNGCGICVVVCEINLEKSQEVESGRGPRFKDDVVLRIDNGRIKLVDPQSCRRADPSDYICRACVELCPTTAISLV